MSAALMLAERDFAPRPTFSARRQPGQLSASEKAMGKDTKAVSVKPEAIVSLTQIAEAANSRPAKEMARVTGMSPSRIYDLRSARFGVTYAHLMALAQAYPPLKRQILAALSGEAGAGSAQAINEIVRSK